MTTPPPSWTPLSEFDNFNPVLPTFTDPNFPWPDYIAAGVEPAVSGIPADNPLVPTMRLGRVIGQGTEIGTWMVRTYDGWLLDNLLPHASYSAGDYMYLMVCGTWCMDMGQRSYLPVVPPIPDYSASPIPPTS